MVGVVTMTMIVFARYGEQYLLIDDQMKQDPFPQDAEGFLVDFEDQTKMRVNLYALLKHADITPIPQDPKIIERSADFPIHDMRVLNRS